ncbi:hypothetical protein M3Y99_01002900 [Aphelenchoides fujianensis]|nr:hypothetical protein M3Y99_01002900 [Aphelenchoides fujianensis]
MEAAIVKRKPRMRAAVRGGLNRFHLADAMETDETKGAVQSVRLALISRAHLASVRRTARGIKFKLRDDEWLLRLDLRDGAPKIVFPLDQTEMIAIVQLLAVLVHLKFGDYFKAAERVDWAALQAIGKYVNGLAVYEKPRSPAFSAFIRSVAPHLRVLTSTWSVLAQLPPLELERARLYNPANKFDELSRHTIRRLEVPVHDLAGRSGPSSSSIRSLGITHVSNWPDFPYDLVEAFCRRFSSLEDLHIVCEHGARIRPELVRDLTAYFTALWAKCLEIRDRLHVTGLKRLFLTVKHNCAFRGTKTDWFEKVKHVEPFHEATSTIDRSNECVWMSLKHNEPRGPKPTFFRFKGAFRWSVQEYEQMAEDLSDEMDDEDESHEEWTTRAISRTQ